MPARAIAWLVKQRSDARGRRRNDGTRDCVVWEAAQQRARKATQCWHARLRGL